ncbi:hypothetical protein CCR97_26950 [Rhodoplanes elegans]|uniref:Uncharacterized protein n=1 Tax=Rhodoplanes elegans TaxID=29408 RepID=A0A327K1F8_9BRAD|nr:hypothetical protein [Rhodoplanes elegans]MBK5961819.1 hypothetical protein [Rhodoplanes elegans]RAI31663.1 hypothetical protein CH338_25480 [Rhodoplanes elegans]
MSPHDRLAVVAAPGEPAPDGRLAGPAGRTGFPPEPEHRGDGGPVGGRTEALRHCISQHLI